MFYEHSLIKFSIFWEIIDILSFSSGFANDCYYLQSKTLHSLHDDMIRPASKKKKKLSK